MDGSESVQPSSSAVVPSSVSNTQTRSAVVPSSSITIGSPAPTTAGPQLPMPKILAIAGGGAGFLLLCVVVMAAIIVCGCCRRKCKSRKRSPGRRPTEKMHREERWTREGNDYGSSHGSGAHAVAVENGTALTSGSVLVDTQPVHSQGLTATDYVHSEHQHQQQHQQHFNSSTEGMQTFFPNSNVPPLQMETSFSPEVHNSTKTKEPWLQTNSQEPWQQVSPQEKCPPQESSHDVWPHVQDPQSNPQDYYVEVIPARTVYTHSITEKHDNNFALPGMHPMHNDSTAQETTTHGDYTPMSSALPRPQTQDYANTQLQVSPAIPFQTPVASSEELSLKENSNSNKKKKKKPAPLPHPVDSHSRESTTTGGSSSGYSYVIVQEDDYDIPKSCKFSPRSPLEFPIATTSGAIHFNASDESGQRNSSPARNSYANISPHEYQKSTTAIEQSLQYAVPSNVQLQSSPNRKVPPIIGPKPKKGNSNQFSPPGMEDVYDTPQNAMPVLDIQSGSTYSIPQSNNIAPFTPSATTRQPQLYLTEPQVSDTYDFPKVRTLPPNGSDTYDAPKHAYFNTMSHPAPQYGSEDNNLYSVPKSPIPVNNLLPASGMADGQYDSLPPSVNPTSSTGSPGNYGNYNPSVSLYDVPKSVRH